MTVVVRAARESPGVKIFDSTMSPRSNVAFYNSQRDIEGTEDKSSLVSSPTSISSKPENAKFSPAVYSTADGSAIVPVSPVAASIVSPGRRRCATTAVMVSPRKDIETEKVDGGEAGPDPTQRSGASTARTEKRSRIDGVQRTKSDPMESALALGTRMDVPLSGNSLRVFAELLQTETDFLRDITTIVEEIMTPIRCKELMTKEEMSSVFANIEALVPVAQEFVNTLKALDARPGGPTALGIAELFLDKSDLLKLYAVYCSNQPNIHNRLQEYCNARQDLSDFLEGLIKEPKLRKLDVESFLIMPLQRLCKYPLILRELHSKCEEDTRDYSVMSQAVLKVKDIVDKVNERVRKVEEVVRLTEIAQDIDNADEFDVVSTDHVLVQSGCFDVDSKPRYVCLFSDVLLLCRMPKKDGGKYHGTDAYKLDKVSVFDIPDDTANGVKHMFEIVTQNSLLICQCGTNLQKKGWYKKLHQATAEAGGDEAEKSRIVEKVKKNVGSYSPALIARKAEKTKRRMSRHGSSFISIKKDVSKEKEKEKERHQREKDEKEKEKTKEMKQIRALEQKLKRAEEQNKQLQRQLDQERKDLKKAQEYTAQLEATTKPLSKSSKNMRKRVGTKGSQVSPAFPGVRMRAATSMLADSGLETSSPPGSPHPSLHRGAEHSTSDSGVVDRNEKDMRIEMLEQVVREMTLQNDQLRAENDQLKAENERLRLPPAGSPKN